MKSTTLKISVAGNDFFLACRRREKFCIGSARDCKLSLDGEGIAAEHCEIERISETDFVVREIDGSEISVNGVKSGEMQIEAPFTLGIGKFRLVAALVDDVEAEGTEEVATDSVEEGTAVFVVPYGPKRKRREKSETRRRSRAGIDPRFAIPALRFGNMAGGLSLSPVPAVAGPAYSAITLPTVNSARPERRHREPQPVGEASTAWFSLMLCMLVTVAVVGCGWFVWRDYRLPRDPERLAQAVGEGDATAMATLGLSKLRGERGSAFDLSTGTALVEKSAAEGDPFGLLVLSVIRDEGIFSTGDTRSPEGLWREALRSDLNRRMDEVSDSRWWTMAAVAEARGEGKFSEGGIKLLRKSARRGYPEAMRALAGIADSDDEAARWWGKAAEAARKESNKGSVYAMRVLGEIHLEGEFPDRDTRLGEDSMRRAAREGDPVAMFRAGLIAEENGEPEDAFEWMSKAVYSGHVDALANLARYRLEGIGTDMDAAKAMELARRAITLGSVEARIVLARGLLRGSDVAEAENAIRPAVEAGNGEAGALLGSIFFAQNRTAEAEPLLREAAEVGNSKAALELGKVLSSKSGPGHREEAVTWLESAYAAGERDAVPGLIGIIDRPGDPSADPERAAELLEDLVDTGDMDAAVRLSDYYLRGRGVLSNPGRALFLLQKAAESGEASAFFPLARLHESGWGDILSKSPRTALSYYQKALESADARLSERFAGIETAETVAKDFLEEWESDTFLTSTNFSATGLERYFHLRDPDAAKIAALEAGFRKLWSRREVSVGSVSVPELVELDRLRVTAEFEFVFSGKGRAFSGAAVATFEFRMDNRSAKIISISETSRDWHFEPSRDRFEIGESSRSVYPALPAGESVYTLANLPRKQIDYVKMFPFTDKFGTHHSMIPTSTRDALVAFSRIESEGDVLLPEVFFDADTLVKIERTIDAQAFGTFDTEYAKILLVPDQKDVTTATLLRRAGGGDHEAEALVGECFYDGLEGFPVDRVEALKWFVKSARARHPLGRIWIALMNSTGEIQSTTPVKDQFRDVLPDLVPIIAESGAAAHYWRATAECYAGAEGIGLDARQPRQMLERAVDRGDLRSRLLSSGNIVASGSADGLRHLRFAADGRCATAAAALAGYYLGDGNDSRLAVGLLEKAAAKNMAGAQLALGKCYATGTGLERDPDRAAFWLETGLANAMRQADRSTEVQARSVIRELKEQIGDDPFRRASNFLAKKKG